MTHRKWFWHCPACDIPHIDGTRDESRERADQHDIDAGHKPPKSHYGWKIEERREHG